jgi:CelD/BcsL family acetyltransferase involved in cellulose biosynthesis
MGCTVTQENFAGLTSYWTDPSQHLKWGSIFVLPPWMEVWWRIFQPEAELYLAVVKDQSDIIGIAPLQLKDNKVAFVGSPDVCDYLDFVVVPGREKDFFAALLDDLEQQGIDGMNLVSLHPDSAAATYLMDTVKKKGFEVRCRNEEVTLELDLPVTWDEYLAGLAKKQRHEVRRKLRRLWEADEVSYRCIDVERSQVARLTDIFLSLFALSRDEKADFMTAQRESFFRSLAGTMADNGLLRYGLLEVSRQPAAMIMGFEYQEALYLYNSAYDPRFNYLSAGLLSKVLCIQESITRGRKRWDFLKGGERYKYELGGQEVPLSHCQIALKQEISEVEQR